MSKFLGKEINISDFLDGNKLVDIKGLTKGKGFQGAVKRFGIGLRGHKSEKGRRGPGSIGPWHPAKLTFRAPLPGQLGFFTRLQMNNLILYVGNKADTSKVNPKSGFMNYGIVRNPFLIVRGSIQGPPKRPLLVTAPLRKKKKIENYVLKL